MVKIYLRYGLKTTFGVVTSFPSNVVFDGSGKCAVTGALEHVLIWDLKKGVKVASYSDTEVKKQPVVSQLVLSPNKLHLAAGYSNGTIRIWNLRTGQAEHTFTGHKSQVTALSFDKSGGLLASGSSDTDLIIWDLITDTGLFKLRGHKNAITDVKFLEKDGRFLVSSSKDFLVKIWDLDTQHCVQTIVGHRAEVWSFDINPDQTRLVTLCEDSLRFYKIETPSKAKNDDSDDENAGQEEAQKKQSSSEMEIDEKLLDDSQSRVIFYGTIDRKTKERGALIRYNLDGSVLAVQSAGKTIELLRIHGKEEIKERRKIRFAREKSKAKKTYQQQMKEHEKLLEQLKSASKNYTEIAIPPEPTLQVPEKVPQPSDELSHAQVLRCDHKIQSFSFSTVSNKEMLVSTVNNTIEHYKIVLQKRKAAADEEPEAEAEENEDESEQLSTIELPGHRSDVRALALSTNNEMLVSTSNGMIKVWNVRTLSVIRTIQSGYGLSVAFTPGDRHIVVGTKAGKIELYDLQSATLLESVDAHTGPVWSVQILPDATGFVSASADKKLKFWDFDLVELADQKKTDQPGLVAPKRLTVNLSKTFELPDDALACKFSKNGKYLAVALLDSTVKIYVVEFMKLFHTLYGHKLPVMSLDISDDNAIIITGSADKNIRIWGMDFGDCHKSMFAHADSVMGLAFVPQTHYFFSVGKDGLLKYWDADKFEHVLSLEGHQSEAWALVVSTEGDFVITGSHDRSLRIWERTDDQVVVSDERETELEQNWEATMEAEDRYATEEKAESAKATKQTMDTIRSGEKLIDAIELIITEEENWKTYENDIKKLKQMGEKDAEQKVTKPPSNELMLGKGPSEYLMHTLKSIRSSDLDESLIILPFNLVLKLVSFLDIWIQKDYNIELCSRILFFILRMYHSQISANKSVQATLHSLRDSIRKRLTKYKDIIGFNQVALNYMKRHMELESNVKFFQAREEVFVQVGAKRQKVTRKNYWE